MPGFVLLANPENRRAQFFEAACRKHGVALKTFSWLEFMNSPDPVLAAICTADAVKIESPGENAEVDALMIRRGADVMQVPYPGALQHAEFSQLALWFQGFTSVLAQLGQVNTRFLNKPAAIATMFDKLETHRKLAQSDIQCPRLLGPVTSFDQLRSDLLNSEKTRAFIKTRHGSSASGVVALRLSHDRQHAVTSLQVDGTTLFNSLKIQRYRTRNNVALVIDAVAAEGAIAEDWIPKAMVDGRVFDLRMVCIGGRASHAVVRTSKFPLTNLHLGNKRGSLNQVQAMVGEEVWAQVEQTAVAAADAIGGGCVGVDIALDSSLRRHWVLEANAFGDLLPGVTDAEGRSTYDAEVDWLKEAS